MSVEFDFEKYWLAKFVKCLDDVAGEEIRKEVIKGSERLSKNPNRGEVINWSKESMEKLDSLVDEKRRIDIMTGCACQYPKSDLQEIRKTYEGTKDIDVAHQMLQKQFISFLKNSLRLDAELVEAIVNRGWGLAGIKKGNTIIATKIP